MRPRRTRSNTGPLAEWRERRGLTQNEAAIELGLDLPRYNAFECGRQRPGLTRAVEIERLTGGAVPVESWVAKAS